MKILENRHIFNKKFEDISAACWKKYPNPYNSSVVSVDVLKRWLDEENRLHTIRLIAMDNHIPYLLAAIFGVDSPMRALEYTVVDRDRKIHQLSSINLSFNSCLTAEEDMIYRGTEHGTTILDHKVTVTGQTDNASVNAYAEDFSVSTTAEKSKFGVYAMELKSSQIMLDRVADKFFWDKFYRFYTPLNHVQLSKKLQPNVNNGDIKSKVNEYFPWDSAFLNQYIEPLMDIMQGNNENTPTEFIFNQAKILTTKFVDDFIDYINSLKTFSKDLVSKIDMG